MDTRTLTELMFEGLPRLDADVDFGALDAATSEMLLEEAAKLGENVLWPLRFSGDKQGCVLENGRVKTPEGSQSAWEQMKSGGWVGMGLPEDLGGSEMPPLMSTAIGSLFSSYNQAFTMTQGLTQGAADLLLAHRGDEKNGDLIEMVLKGFASGDVAGTMNLTEPQCGTDLGLIKTKAQPCEGGFEISGQKIWISSGDQDLTKEIVHLVLAREPGLEEGIKGVSLFLVPSHYIQDGNFTSERNAVSCIGLEDKMGIHASPTCVMSFEKAWGVRIGEPGKGVRQMFVMMNAARLLVAGQGLAGAAAAWRESKAFALERRAGQAVGRPPVEGSVPIIKHADVRRMVLEQEAFLKAGWMALCWGGALMEETGPRKALLDLLIPVLKSTLTDKGLESALTAQQLMGGMGFVRDGKVESIVRDLRITTVYEGTNGIQALDLVGRKLMAQGGAGVRLFLEKMKTVSTGSVVQDSLNAAIEDLEAILKELMTWGITDLERVTGVMVDVQEAFGLVLLGGCLAASGDELRAQFWAQRHLGKTRLLLERVKHSDWVKDTFEKFD